MKPNTKNVLEMLKESNAIEGVYDRQSLVNAHRAWKFMMEQDSLCIENILTAHRILMTNQNIDNKYRGDWRDVPVTIGGELKSQSKIVISSLMRDFVDHVNGIMSNDDKNHDAVHCHLQFENIHPFVDGNGRTGRILLNWQLVKMGMPLLVYTEEDRKTYYRLFPSYRKQEMMKLHKIVMELAKNINGKQNKNDNNSTDGFSV